MTPEQKIKRLEDIISWAQNNVHDVGARKVIARAMRQLEDEEREARTVVRLPCGRLLGTWTATNTEATCLLPKGHDGGCDAGDPPSAAVSDRGPRT